MSKLSKKALFVKRSEAAKKGWDTRRARQQDNRSSGTKRDKKTSGGVKTAPKSRPRANNGGHSKGSKAPRPSTADPRRSVRSLEREIEKLKKEQERDRAAIRTANQKALKSLKATETMIANMARNGVPIRNILRQIPESGHQHAKEVIVQTRLDMAAELYEDVRWEAFDLADELDWDISEVFDAWSYDEGAVA